VGSGRYQQVYNFTNFPGPLVITDVRFFDTQIASVISTGTYTLKLSTTDVAVNSLAGADAAGMDSNIGADVTTVFSGALGGDVPPSGFEIDFTTPFSYDPATGNLLLEIVNVSITSRGSGFLDARNGSAGTIFSRMHTYGGGFSSYGLVTEFSTGPLPPPGVPEPASLALLGAGLAAFAACRGLRRSRP
jgi:hypothetical protein